jgi:autotransporter strand-loop-strand O-heptosyltransferase
MKITQVTPGIISIPPNGWGAIEKIVWNYKNALEKYDFDCDIKYFNDLDVNNADIVHIHVANLAIEAKKSGIPYIFSLHDHHVYKYGKNSDLYNENLEAIKGSIISFCHAEFLVDFFDDTDKLFYLSHGVDTSYFTPSSENKLRQDIKLLCVANNGYYNDNSFDRKGFRYAIEAAKELNLPITIVGPENNSNFFNKNQDLLKYDKLNIISKNVTEEELLEIYRTHDIFLHPSELEAGHPNLTILEAISCSMPVVGVYDGSIELKGLVKAERNTKSVVYGINKVVLNYEDYVDRCKDDREKFNWDVIVDRLRKIYQSVINIKKEFNSEDAKKAYLETYSTTIKRESNKINPKEIIKFNVNFIEGAFVEITGRSGKLFNIEFFDGNDCVFNSSIGINQWTKTNRKYFTDWRVKVSSEGEVLYDKKIDLSGKRVYVAIDSSSIGDNIAWIAYLDEFRKKHNCKLIASTFWNSLFKDSYSQIEFVEPGEIVNNTYAMYTVGCFFNADMEPEAPNTIPLQKVPCNTLGLEYAEIKPIVSYVVRPKPYLNKYVTIAPHSTAGLKYWNNNTGWQEVVDFLISQGYKVINVSREGCNLKGVQSINDYSMSKIMTTIHHSEFFIGLSSGLSWIAWALGKKVVMISNFTDSQHEFSENCIRIINEDVCHACWVKPEFVFDKGDWNWCPLHKGTERQFECSKSITGQMVIDNIKNII